jgi:hypothetical protein
VPRKKPAPKSRTTKSFDCQGGKQFAQVVDHPQRVQRCRGRSRGVVEEVVCPVTPLGCYIEEIGASPSGAWLVTQRISGQGEWGYDVFRTSPRAREAGVVDEPGYILDLPKFAADESWLVGGAGPGFLGGWWAHPDDEPDEQARGGPASLGFLFVHRLPSHRVTRHELRVQLPKGWLLDDPWDGWLGPRDITPTAGGVRLVPSWGVPVGVKTPLPRVIRLPAPHPSGRGLL